MIPPCFLAYSKLQSQGEKKYATANDQVDQPTLHIHANTLTDRGLATLECYDDVHETPPRQYHTEYSLSVELKSFDVVNSLTSVWTPSYHREFVLDRRVIALTEPVDIPRTTDTIYTSYVHVALIG